MKRLLLATAMAFGVHGLVLGIDPEWMAYEPPAWKHPAPMSITLSYIDPIRTARKPDVVKPKSLQKTPQKILVPKPKPVTKATPQSVKKATPAEKQKIAPRAPEKPETDPVVESEAVIPQEPADLIEPTHDQTDAETNTELSALTPTPAPFSTPEVEIVKARPLYRQNPPPPYPRAARKRGYQGTVILEVLVDRDGDVETLKIYRSSGYKALDNAAMGSVKRWIFEPGRRGEDTVDMWVRVPIAFRLTE